MYSCTCRLLFDAAGQRPYDIAWSHGHRSLLWALTPRVPLAALLRPPTATVCVPSLAALAAAALRQRLVQQLAELKEAAAEAERSSVAAAAAAGAPRTPKQRSWPCSREGSSHGGAAYAAFAVAAAAAARLSRSSAGRASMHRRHGSAGPAAAPRQMRHSSDGGAALPGVLPVPPVGGATATIAPATAPPLSKGAGPPLAPSTPPQAADAPAGGSVHGCRTAASVVSVAGCPICLDSALEVAVTPCSHGLCLECAQHLSAPEDASGSGHGRGSAAGAAPPLCPLCRGLMCGFRLLP